MAYSKQIIKKIEEYDYHLFNMAEAFIDREEELLEKIANLENDISEHSCE